MANKKKVLVETDALKLVEREIRDIAAAVKRLDNGPLKRGAIVNMIYDQTLGIKRNAINVVLDVARDLPSYVLKKAVKDAKS